MMDFGKALRAAREAKGLSIAQLGEMTRLAPTTIANLENEDFRHIAAPIYGRGFVRLYCEAVGLAPKPFIDEYMEIMQGNRMPTIRERPPVVEEAEPPAPVPPPVAPEPPQRQDDLFKRPLSQSSTPPSTRRVDASSLSRYAAPLRTIGLTVSSSWRLVILAVGVGIALALLVFALRALHRATSPNRIAEDDLTAFTDEQPPAAPAAPATDQPAVREQQSIPALYID